MAEEKKKPKSTPAPKKPAPGGFSFGASANPNPGFNMAPAAPTAPAAGPSSMIDLGSMMAAAQANQAQNPDLGALIRELKSPSPGEARRYAWEGAQMPSYTGDPNNAFNNGFFNSDLKNSMHGGGPTWDTATPQQRQSAMQASPAGAPDIGRLVADPFTYTQDRQASPNFIGPSQPLPGPQVLPGVNLSNLVSPESPLANPLPSTYTVPGPNGQQQVLRGVADKGNLQLLGTLLRR